MKLRDQFKWCAAQQNQEIRHRYTWDAKQQKLEVFYAGAQRQQHLTSCSEAALDKSLMWLRIRLIKNYVLLRILAAPEVLVMADGYQDSVHPIHHAREKCPYRPSASSAKSLHEKNSIIHWARKVKNDKINSQMILPLISRKGLQK